MKYQLTSPDGQKFEITAPDDATEAQIIEFAQKNMPQQGKVVPQPTQQTQPTPKPPEAGFLQETVSNIPESAAKFGKGLVEAITHPVETAKSLVDVGAGALKAVTPEPIAKAIESFNWNPEATKRAEKMYSAVSGEYKKRYGSLEDLKNTVKKDPVAVAADISILAGLAGKAAQVSGMTRTAGAFGKVSEVTNPLTPAVGAVKHGLVKPISGGLKFVTSKTTGAGAEAIGRARIGSEAFKETMRGKVGGEEVIGRMRDSLSQMKDDRAAAYASQLEKISKNKKPIPIKPIKVLADKWLDKYNVKKTSDGLDFSRSTVSGTSAKEVQDVYSMIQDWGTRAGDNTPAMLDILKRRLDDYYSTSNNSRAMVTSLKNYVKNKIVSEVPEYAKMTSDYAKSSALIKETEKALSLGDRASADTALRKVMTAIREDSHYRRDLIKTLEKTGDTGLLDSISGLMLNTPYSNRLGSLMAIMGVGGASLILTNPKMLGLLALASPRLVGEFTYLAGKIGQGAKGLKPVAKAAPAISTLGQVQGGLNGR